MRVYNANSYAVVASITVGSNPSVSAPLSAIVSPDNSRVYVTIFDENKIAVIDAATNTVTGYYATDNRPTGIDISNDGSKLYVANQNTNSVIVFNTTTGSRITTIDLGPTTLVNGGAAGLVLNHANTRAYVAIQDASQVKVIDLATNTVTQTIPVGGRPFGIDILPNDSRVYASCVDANRFDII
ncbi:MAG: beta-propeller fold lactonase family protein, partial [Dinghuibacter sp.]|nr:beta-propeller fold lactonase family protein [Dinghuibacter sp.]